MPYPYTYPFLYDYGTEYPIETIVRVSSIRHICRPGFNRMQVGLGDLGFDIDMAETTLRKALDTTTEAERGKVPVDEDRLERVIEEERRLRELGAEPYRRKYTGMQIPPPEFEDIRQFPGPPKPAPPKPAPPPAPPTLWQRVTPWKEERGETFLSEFMERWRALTPWREEAGETFGGEVMERVRAVGKFFGGLFR